MLSTPLTPFLPTTAAVHAVALCVETCLWVESESDSLKTAVSLEIQREARAVGGDYSGGFAAVCGL